ncbi:PSD1 and planctomycete cytochrome C domain-containing protein [Algoriphagus halophytocola]|uniref:PSD1 and planctomycete cytochrome C domain-containing protein n=1 Tax=Algoriphagus halophytocola TaxID=2991499 RepID=A0ABY6MHR2_9BACT|nr:MULTISPECIES: PSD1 and planctomycete cytochrome C domain-containing protein [unclassified Algoriphagus]UZD23331.1 PSD1 and planctomycete cytochrome C domain-containing protein [Algoriphagus sp. TR-M5]WBL44626.1 PSD1 and planctomycete cytochrome C domain-containing protein [Algoriphagus sp. TR-M9]
MSISKTIRLLLICAILASCSHEQSQEITLAETEQISYNFHIRPILSDKCFVCHGPDANKREADLRLDTEAGAYAALKEDPDQYVIKPGSLEESTVYHRITSEDPGELMPPPESNLALTEGEINLIKVWIAEGAKYEPHWAFVKPEKSSPPSVGDWATNEIDQFILKKMQSKGLEPNPEAEPHELIKRASLDLTGLPPSPELLDKYGDFNGDESYENLLDGLMADPGFGEKMAILWMDISRYSDSYGYQDDNIRTQWPYRDWVIHAFNQNMPYDQFITWQLAGDLLPDANKEQILATAFNRNHKYTEEGGVIDEEYRIEYVLDKTNTVSKGLLGITMECAQCHDHKYDPFSQKEYFEMFAFFNNTPEKGYEGDVSVSKPAKTPILWVDQKDLSGVLDFINYADSSKLSISVMGELEEARPTYILDRGVYDAPTTEVEPSTPASIMEFPEDIEKNRLGLAKWMTAKENPLTARVFVNLMWQEVFGQGIVKSAGDFGMQGDLPTHPELLDWLAVDFMENGWNIKRLLKQIMSSSTYRQSARIKQKHLKVDPENLYLSRASRLRLPAENIQDLVLASSGLLVRKLGGPSVKPYMPEGIWEAASSGRGELATYQQDKGDKLYRRGLYNFIKLTVPPPKAIIFDSSNRDRCEVGRTRTNTPLQALVMMNDPMVLEASRVLASKVLADHQTEKAALAAAFKRILCRNITEKESDILTAYYEDQLYRFQEHTDQVKAALEVGEYPLEEKDINSKTAAMMQVIVSMYNLEETITKS